MLGRAPLKYQLGDAMKAAVMRNRGGRLGMGVLAVILLGAGAFAAYKSARQALWFDEICTIAVSKQGSTAGIWSALYHAADTNPPLFYLIELASSRVTANERLAYRLPALIGLLMTPPALFFFLRRAGTLAALSAAVVPLLTSLYTTYAMEARPYALMIGCIAWAMVMWQQSDRPGRTVLLGLLLALAVCLHYYAVLAFFPFIVGEAARYKYSGVVRTGVWFALLGGLLPLAAFWPLLWNLRQYYGANFWGGASLAGAVASYGEILQIVPLIAIVPVFVLAAGLHASVARQRTAGEADLPSDRLRPEECLMVLGFIALPLAGYVLTLVTHGGMSSRYFLPTILGISISAGYLISRLGRLASLTFLLLCAAVSPMQSGLIRQPLLPGAELDLLYEMMDQSNAPELPVVVSAGWTYLPMAYYRSQDQQKPRAALVALVSFADAVKYAHNDSADRILSVLRFYLPLDVRDFSSFLRGNRRFLLYSSDADQEWLPGKLTATGVPLVALAAQRHHTLYLVEQTGANREHD
jgi:hypothetical protein